MPIKTNLTGNFLNFFLFLTQERARQFYNWLLNSLVSAIACTCGKINVYFFFQTPMK